MTTALTTIESLPLAELRDPDATADFIIWLGIQDLPNLPDRKDVESDRNYALRVFNHRDTSRRTKSEVIVMGLSKASVYRQALSDGIQLICYRAYKYGWWVDTQDSGGDEAAFRTWVRNAVTADGASDTEATQLASTILNLFWLKHNHYKGLPKDLEDIFRDRSQYSRWRRVASKLRKLIQAVNDWEQPEEEDDEPSGLEELEETIQQYIKDVNNPEKGTDDLDQLGGRPKAPPVLIELTGYDPLGRATFEGAATPTQLNLLRNATSRLTEWRLRGEAYDITESHVLARYRFYGGKWARQIWDNAWSDFEPCGEPDFNGNQEGAPLIDTELGLTYITQWEEL